MVRCCVNTVVWYVMIYVCVEAMSTGPLLKLLQFESDFHQPCGFGSVIQRNRVSVPSSVLQKLVHWDIGRTL